MLAAASRAGGYVTIEIAHPLSSGDAHDFALGPGDSLGWGMGGAIWTSPTSSIPLNAGGLPGSDIRILPLDATPPILQLPPDMSVDATDPNGVVVSYTVTTTDNADPNPTLSCSPPSGSLFLIGDTTVECTAADAAGNSSMGSFDVHVMGASEQIADLIALVDSYRLDKLGTSLQDKLVSVQGFLVAGKPLHAEENLGAFVAQVRAQRGKGLTHAQAEELEIAARRIIDVIET